MSGRRVARVYTTGLAALLIAVTASVAVAGEPAKRLRGGSRTAVYTLPGTSVFPEGVALDPITEDFYVSSTSTGAIFRGVVGRKATAVFLPGGADERTTAIGLKVDRRRRLYVAGGATGRIWVYDLATRRLIRRFETGPGGFVNDLAVTRSGDVYATDSRRPLLFKITPEAVAAGRGDTVPLTPDLTFGPELEYATGTNANGVARSPGGRFLLVVQSRTGKLFRVEPATDQVREVDLGGASLLAGDGIALEGRTLFVLRNRFGLLVTVRLNDGLTAGTVQSAAGNGTFRYPTTLAIVRDRLLVVNSQFDQRAAGLPGVAPFTVSSVQRP